MRCLRCQSGPGSTMVVHGCGPMRNMARPCHVGVPAWCVSRFVHLRNGNKRQGLQVGLGSVVGTSSWDVRVVVACCRHGRCCLRFLLARLRRGYSKMLLRELGWSSANARAASGQQDDLLECFILRLCRLDSVRDQRYHGVAAMNSKIVRLTDICFVLPDPESLFKDQPDDSTVLASSKFVTQFLEKHRLQQSTSRGHRRCIQEHILEAQGMGWKFQIKSNTFLCFSALAVSTAPSVAGPFPCSGLDRRGRRQLGKGIVF